MLSRNGENRFRTEWFRQLRLDVLYAESNYGGIDQTRYEIAVYIFLGVLGILGNISTCVVIACNKSMRTVTNVYLFNLAISDLLILIFGFPPLSGYITFYRINALCMLRYVYLL